MRRYTVKGFSGHPGWSGCIWAVGCSKVQSAESLFERRVAAGYGSADFLRAVQRLISSPITSLMCTSSKKHIT